ncbi:MAG TPA: hypothetical protein PKW95_22470 [bacterium]|nr:hypothetical protein [bacterium]
MIRMNGFLHRDRLAAIIDHWIMARPELMQEVGDLKWAVNFNAYVSMAILNAFAQTAFAKLYGDEVFFVRAQTKGQMKDLLIQNPPESTTRIEEMIDHYRRYPQDFYRETPVNGLVYFRNENDSRLLGTARVKRFRRIAEKGGRYLIDFIFQEIKTQADALAAERAERQGIPVEQLNTSNEEQISEFIHAERRILKAIRLGQIASPPPVLPINDILGLKVVIEGVDIDKAIDQIGQCPNISLQEQEKLVGNYNATNLIVRFRWPREEMLKRSPSGEIQSAFRKRGCSRDTTKAYKKFIESAEDEVTIEVSLISYEEMLESEIGRSMHEERILAQRQNQQYQGSLTRNIEYLMDYLFRFALSTTKELNEVPIQLWVRYMPDYIDHILRRLYNSSEEIDYFQAFIQNSESPKREE